MPMSKYGSEAHTKVHQSVIKLSLRSDVFETGQKTYIGGMAMIGERRLIEAEEGEIVEVKKWKTS